MGREIPWATGHEQRRLRVKLIDRRTDSFHLSAQNRKFSLIALGWAFNKVSMTRAAIAIQGQTAALFAR